MRLITEKTNGSRLGDFLSNNLKSNASSFRGAAAFLRASAMTYLHPLIKSFSGSRPFELAVGVDLQGTTVEGLEMLLDALGVHGQARVFHNAGSHTFHPKLFKFEFANKAEVYVGSGNLTRGGLYTNHEAGIHLSLDRGDQASLSFIQQIDAALDDWTVNAGAASLPLTTALIGELRLRKLILTEAATRAATAASTSAASAKAPSAMKPIFGTSPVAAPPKPLIPMPSSSSGSSASTNSAPLVKKSGTGQKASAKAAASGPAISGQPTTFVMTLQKTDVGSGQTTAGTIRRSPEIFIPLAARDAEPNFWGWQSQFTPDLSRPGKMDRTGVRFQVNGKPVLVNMMTWPDKSDFRLRSEALRSAGNIGDILHIEKASSGGLDYIATTIPAGSAKHAKMLKRCTQSVRPPSKKQFGYF